jgi:hypothetical protein
VDQHGAPDPTGRSLPDPGFPGDEGDVDAALAEALDRYGEDRRRSPVLVAVTSARLLVPVVALLGEVEVDEHGLARDKTADIAAVLMHGQDGRVALLAFSGLAALRAWREDARPVPVAIADAATAALQEQAHALVLDVAGPTTFVVERDELAELAAGHLLCATSSGYAWVAAG